MKKVLILFFILFAGKLLGQVVNIENRRVNDGTYGFSGALDMTLSAQKQKDLLVTLHFKPLIQFKFSGKSDFQFKKNEDRLDSLTENKDTSTHVKPDKNKHLLLLINDLKYTGARKNTYANFGMMHLRYAYRIGNSSWKWESYSQIQYNQLLLQKVRTLVGSGFRYKIADLKQKEGGFDKRAIRLFVGTSLFYEYEEIKYSFRPMEYINSVRWSSYFSTYFNFKVFEFSSTTYIQPNLASFKDYRVSGDYSLLLRITDPFSVKLNYSHFYDSKPPETVINSTFSFSAGFVYKLDKFSIDKLKRKPRAPREKEVFE
jgi:hypothetical protein